MKLPHIEGENDMKKALAIFILTLTVVCSVFAAGRRDEVVVDLGYVMPTTTSYDLEDSETYSKALSNGMDIGFRSYKSGLFGSYIGWDFVWPHKTTYYVGDKEVGSKKISGYESLTAFDAQIGIYSPMLDFGFLKIPFGVGVHAAYQNVEYESGWTSSRNSSLDIGFAGWVKAELQLAKKIGLYMGLDVAYDLYEFTWTEVGSKKDNDQKKVKNIEIAPSIGISIRF